MVSEPSALRLRQVQQAAARSGSGRRVSTAFVVSTGRSWRQAPAGCSAAANAAVGSGAMGSGSRSRSGVMGSGGGAKVPLSMGGKGGSPLHVGSSLKHEARLREQGVDSRLDGLLFQ